jgi:hypothetical protein
VLDEEFVLDVVLVLDEEFVLDVVLVLDEELVLDVLLALDEELVPDDVDEVVDADDVVDVDELALEAGVPEAELPCVELADAPPLPDSPALPHPPTRRQKAKTGALNKKTEARGFIMTRHYRQSLDTAMARSRSSGRPKMQSRRGSLAQNAAPGRWNA